MIRYTCDRLLQSGHSRPALVSARRILFALAALTLSPNSIIAAPRFTLQRMVSPLYVSDQSHATDINDDGYVTVSFYNKGYAGSWYSYLWKDGVTYPPDMGYALRVNNHNQVTGYGGTASSSYGGFWDGSQSLQLDELPGTQYWNRPYALNDAGQIYGYSLGEFDSPYGWERAVGWTPTGQLFDMQIPANGTWGNIPQAVNNQNQVVGYADGRNTQIDTSRAWLWQNGTAEQLAKLPNSVQPRSWAYGINDQTVVVGAYFDDKPHGVIAGAARWQNGELTILPDPPGTQYSTAYDINEAGYMVGLTSLTNPPYSSAVFWEPNGKAYVLDSLVNNPQGLKLEQALAINNRNQIVGIADDANGNQYGFVLTPVVPEPGAIASIIAVLLSALLARCPNPGTRRVHSG